MSEETGISLLKIKESLGVQAKNLEEINTSEEAKEAFFLEGNEDKKKKIKEKWATLINKETEETTSLEELQKILRNCPLFFEELEHSIIRKMSSFFQKE
jgi:DNA-binding transcriptional MerR regulator